MGLDLGSLLEQAQEMAAGMAEAQQAAAETIVEGSAGGGVVTVTVTGTMEFQKVTISPDAIDPDDPGMLEDLVLAALRDAARRVGELQQQSLGGLGPMGGQLGGLLGGG
jgi:nucleoid-associated protein EbfC